MSGNPARLCSDITYSYFFQDNVQILNTHIFSPNGVQILHTHSLLSDYVQILRTHIGNFSSSLQFISSWTRVCFTFPSNNNKNKNLHLISQLLLTQIWQNFKRRYLGTSRTDFSCHGDICSGNISPGDIRPYQQYLSSYWPNLTKLVGPNSLGASIFVDKNFFWTKLPLYPPTTTQTQYQQLFPLLVTQILTKLYKSAIS